MGCICKSQKPPVKSLSKLYESNESPVPADPNQELFVVNEELSCNEQSYAPSKRGSYAVPNPASIVQELIKRSSQNSEEN